MKWGITGDIHLRIFDDKEYSDEGIPLKLSEILKTFDNMCLYCQKQNINKIAILGDINDTKEIAAVDAFSIFKDILKKYSDITFYIIYGNHDMTSSEGIRTAIDLLAGPKNVITITKPTIIDNILFVPYIRINLIETLNNMIETDILLTHIGVSDAQLSNGSSIKSSISVKHLSKWKLVLSGHYHKPQNVDNLWYVGSLIPLTRSEYDEEKRFIILDTETLKIESIPTSGYRKYFNFIIDKNVNKDEILAEAYKAKKEGNFVTVRNRLSEVIINDDINIIDECEEEFESRGINNAMTEEERMRKYIDIMRIPKDNIEEYITIGLEIINKETIETLDIEEVDTETSNI